jgi:hypothetical protein
MKNILRSALAAATLSLALVTVSRAVDPEPGFVDLGQFAPSEKGQFVEVNLSPGLLKFAAKIAAVKEPEAAALLGNLRRVRVNVVSLDDKNRAGTVEQINAIRRKLATQGWTQIVTVREKEGGDNVDVHVKQNADDSIDGIVVTVIDKKGEAVFVNIVGNITADQLGVIAEKFDIDPLRKVHSKLEHKAKDV